VGPRPLARRTLFYYCRVAVVYCPALAKNPRYQLLSRALFLQQQEVWLSGIIRARQLASLSILITTVIYRYPLESSFQNFHCPPSLVSVQAFTHFNLGRPGPRLPCPPFTPASFSVISALSRRPKLRSSMSLVQFLNPMAMPHFISMQVVRHYKCQQGRAALR
jgi:hypothetical protein